MEKTNNFKTSFKKSKCCNSTIYKTPDFYSSSMFNIKEVEVCSKCGEKS